MIHKAALKMDEQGAEGAAGSGMEVLPMQTRLKIKINRPFLLTIFDNSMNNILFIGRISNPSGN